ncbi:MAG TPA: TIGR02217 family protein [Alphaproteobacteria bacterium]|nr:TIGR02217 family protein [Alphaproteobacteria bacterium]
MTSFHEIKFPSEVSFKAKCYAEFKTSVVSLNSGYEKRNQQWLFGRRKYEIEFKNIGKAEANKVISFFQARNGKLNGFRFKDWDEFEAKDENVGIGDGETTEFQLIKNYGDENYNYQRKITKPVEGKLIIKQNGSVVSGSAYDVFWDKGIISFDTAPDTGAIITADFEFDVPVRFDTDFLSLKTEEYGKSSIEKISLIEIKQ